METNPEDFGIDNTEPPRDVDTEPTTEALEAEPAPESFEELDSPNETMVENNTESPTNSSDNLPPISENEGFQEMPAEFQQAISEREREIKALEEHLENDPNMVAVETVEHTVTDSETGELVMRTTDTEPAQVALDRHDEEMSRITVSESSPESQTQKEIVPEKQPMPKASVTPIRPGVKLPTDGIEVQEAEEIVLETKKEGLPESELVQGETVPVTSEAEPEVLVPEEQMVEKKEQSVGEILQEEQVTEVTAESIEQMPADTPDQLYKKETAKQEIERKQAAVAEMDDGGLEENLTKARDAWENDEYRNQPEESDLVMETEETLRQDVEGKVTGVLENQRDEFLEKKENGELPINEEVAKEEGGPVLDQFIEQNESVEASTAEQSSESPEDETNSEAQVEKIDEEPTDSKEVDDSSTESIDTPSNEEIVATAAERASEGADVRETFREEFGISEQELDSISGFNDLEEGQKLLVAENLKQLAMGHLEETRAAKFEEMNAEAGQKRFGKIRQVWNSIRKGSHMKRIGKEVFAENMKAGLEFHKEDLEGLVEAAKEAPGVKKLEDGSLQIQYASGFENLTEEQSESVEKFNVIANEFARVPLEWKYAKEGSKERAQYEEMKLKFESSKDFVQELKESKENREEAIRFEARMAEGVEINQFFNANPDVEERLAVLKNGESFGQAFMRNAKEKGVYMAAGGVTRHALTYVMGGIAFPAAIATGGIMGAFKGRKEGYKDIDDRNFKARYGEKHKDLEERNVNDITHSTKQLELLIDKIETTEDVVERAALMGQLERRADINSLKDEEGKLNFGKRGESVGNVSRFINKMGEARALLELDTPPAEINDDSEQTEIVGNIDLSNLPQYFEKTKWGKWQEEQKENLIKSGTPEEEADRMVLDIMIKSKETQKSRRASERLEKILDFHEEDITEKNKAHVKRKTWDGAKTGMKFAFVGALISDYISDGPITSKAKDIAGDIKEAVAGGSSHYEDLVSSLNVEEGAVVAEAGAAAASGEQPSTFQDMLEQAKQTVAERGGETPASAIALEHNVEAGDNLWNIIGDKIDSGMYTESMNEAQRTHFIDAIKDRFAGMSNEELSEMGFSHIGADGRIDIGALEVGDKLDLSKVLNDTNFMSESLKDTVTLSEEAQASIAENLANPQGAETVADSVVQSSTENVAESASDTTADVASQASEGVEPGGSGSGTGGGEEVFSSEATAMPETDEGVKFEGAQESVAEENFQERLAEDALDDFADDSGILAEVPPERWAEIQQKAAERSKWINNRVEELRARPGNDRLADATLERVAEGQWRNEQIAKIAEEEFGMTGNINEENIPITPEMRREYILEAEQPNNFRYEQNVSQAGLESQSAAANQGATIEQSKGFGSLDDLGPETSGAEATYPDLQDTRGWNQFTLNRRSELIEQGLEPQKAHNLATMETEQIKLSLASEVQNNASETVTEGAQTQVKTPNYTGSAEAVTKPSMGVRMSPEVYQQQQETYGEEIKQKIESIFIDENPRGTRAARRLARDTGVGRAVRDQVKDAVPRELRSIFNANKLGRATEEAVGDRIAGAVGANVENNMDQWDALRKLTVEKFQDAERALGRAGDSFENRNVRDLSRLLKSFDRAGIEPVADETIDEYVLRGTSILGGVPKK